MANFGEEIIEGALRMAVILLLLSVILSICGCSYKYTSFIDENGMNFTQKIIYPPFVKVREDDGKMGYDVLADGSSSIAVGTRTEGYDAGGQVQFMTKLLETLNSIYSMKSIQETKEAEIESNVELLRLREKIKALEAEKEGEGE